MRTGLRGGTAGPLLLCLLCLLRAGPSRAAPGTAPAAAQPAPPQAEDPKAAAKRHYDRGTALFALDRYDEAIKEFEAGYLEVPLPAFLYNIGQAHRKAGRTERARSYFERYLEMAPEAADRPQVERIIAEIDAALTPAAPAAAPPQPPAPTPAAAIAAPAAPPAASAAPSDKAPEAAPRRTWLWGVIGGAGALVVAGVVVGVVLATRAPSTDFGVVEPFK